MKHHLVSGVLLRQWSNFNGNKQVMTYNRETGRSRETGIRGLCTLTTAELAPADQELFEDRWNEFETPAGRTLKKMNHRDGIADDERDLAAIKDLLSVHLVRSFRYRERHRGRFLPALRNSASVQPVHVQFAAFRNNHNGIYPPNSLSRGQLEFEWLCYMQSQLDQGPFVADAMMEFFEIIKRYIDARPLAILTVAPSAPALLIGDCPVLPLAGPNGVSNELFGPQVGAYFLPLGRRHAVLTVPNGQSILDSDLVNYYNSLQVKESRQTIVWCPDDPLEDFVISIVDGS